MKKWCILATPETREYIVEWAKSFFHYSGDINNKHWKYFYSEEVDRLSAPKFFSGTHAEEYPLISFEQFKLLTNININYYEIY